MRVFFSVRLILHPAILLHKAFDSFMPCDRLRRIATKSNCNWLFRWTIVGVLKLVVTIDNCVILFELILVHGIGNWFIGVLVGFMSLNVAGIRLTFYFEEQLGVVTLEKRVLELDIFRWALAFMEIVHVQLADKRVDVVVLEVRWKRLVCKSFFAGHLEA